MVDSKNLKTDADFQDDSFDDEIIELTQIVEDDPLDDDVIDLTSLASHDDGSHHGAVEKEKGGDLAEHLVSLADIRELLEEIVADKYAAKVEHLLEEIVEKMVRKEVNALKKRLLKGLLDQ